MKGWIHVTAIFPKYQGKQPRGPEDVQMKAVYLLCSRVTEIAECTEDDFPMVRSQVYLDTQHSMYLSESPAEVLDLLSKADI